MLFKFAAIIPVIVALCISYLIYLKGEVEWSCYLPCIILNFIVPENIINNYDNLINIRKMIDSSGNLDQGPDNINFIDTYYIPNYENYQDDKLLLRIYNYNMLESNHNNNDNNKNNNNNSNDFNDDKMYENVRNDYKDDTITDKNNSKNNNKLKKVLIFYFPGAWVFGNIESVHGTCKYFATFTDFLVVSVQYRLAPEYAYPHAFYDAYAALQWVKHNIYKYGGDSKHIFISGDDDDNGDAYDDFCDANNDDNIGIVMMKNVNEMFYYDDWNDSSGDMMGNISHDNLIDMIDLLID